MSSSSTETAAVEVVDAPDGRVGLARARSSPGASRPATGSSTRRRSATSRPTRSTPRCPSPAAGRVAEILVEPGQTVDGRDGARADRHRRRAPARRTPARPRRPRPATRRAGRRRRGRRPPPAAASGRRASRPAALQPRRRARIAAEHGIDLDAVQGTGRGGRVRKQDVLALVDGGRRGRRPSARAAAAHRVALPARARPPPRRPPRAAAGGPRGEPLSRMRRTIGEHMKRSLEHGRALHDDGRVRHERASSAARALIGTTALPIVARCAVEALREFPRAQRLAGGRHASPSTTAVHLGIAVSLGDDGLIVPGHPRRAGPLRRGPGPPRRATSRGARARRRPAPRRRARRHVHDHQPRRSSGRSRRRRSSTSRRSAILDLEAVVKRPVVVTGADGEDAIAIRPMTILCMSWDHRALDGAYAARFLSAVRRRLESV